MGQYHLTVNLDKHEFLHPHKLGDGLKLWEQLNSQGGGDLWDGDKPEDTKWVGRWAGDRIAVVGDYAKQDDLSPIDHADLIKDLCYDPQKAIEHYRKLAREAREHGGELYGRNAEDWQDKASRLESLTPYKDISDQILPLVERACDVKITGEGWRQKYSTTGPTTNAFKPDIMVINLGSKE